MPELPEVEAARALIAGRGLGREIAEVDDGDTYVCRPHAPGEIAGALEGARLTRACRRGKTMWCETDRGPVLGLHLGMAGKIVIDGAEAGEPKPDGPVLAPQWDRFTLRFDRAHMSFDAAAQGLGVALESTTTGGKHLAEGKLQPVLGIALAPAPLLFVVWSNGAYAFHQVLRTP